MWCFLLVYILFPAPHLSKVKRIQLDAKLQNLTHYKDLFLSLSVYVMRSSKMSLKSNFFVFCILAFSTTILFKHKFGENPMETGQ